MRKDYVKKTENGSYHRGFSHVVDSNRRRAGFELGDNSGFATSATITGILVARLQQKNLATILHFDGKTDQVINTADDLKQTKKLYINSTYEKVGDKVDGKIKWARVKHSKNSDELDITGWTYTKISKAKAQVYLDAVKKAREDAQTYS